MYFFIDKVDGYIEESNENRYLTLVSTDENKDPLKNYAELWDEIKDLNKSITNTSGDYDERYMKIKFNSDDNLPLKKVLKLHNLIIVVRSAFQETKKYYPKFS